jgi:hypothetical protein
MFGVGHPAGLVASAYLCTAGLIIAAYMLARRFGGERLGLVTALLLAFNPHVLRLAQEPVPQSAATMFAVLALAGAVAHWQKSGALASYQLLLGGIALGLCLLAGGPVALAVVLILLGYAAWWKVDGFRRSRSAEFVDRSQLSRRTAVRSVLVLAATGFAVGGWRTLLMGSRYGMAFWKSWLGIPATQAVNVAEPAVGSPSLPTWRDGTLIPGIDIPDYWSSGRLARWCSGARLAVRRRRGAHCRPSGSTC